jgi:UDP-glucose 4-epimerase
VYFMWRKIHPMVNKVMIIGGAGFIGSSLVKLCLDQGCQVSVYDDFSTGHREYLLQQSGLQVFESSVLDLTSLAKAIGQFAPQVLFHLAAIHYIPAC